MGYTVRISQEQLGDYGHFTTGHFHCLGNLFSDAIELSISEQNIKPRQQNVTVGMSDGIAVVGGIGWSLPSDDAFNSLLVLFSTRLADAYLVTRVVQCTSKCEPLAHM